MARFSRLQVYSEMIRAGLIPLYYHPDVDMMKRLIRACVEGGCTVFEFTNRGDKAYPVFLELIEYCEHEHPNLILGVGSVVDAGTASLFIECGANFIVGSVFNPEIAKVCNRRKVAYVPGCYTPSEISSAEEMGVEIVKVFPGNSLGGPEFVKAILGPTPWTRIMVTGGIKANKEDIQAWFRNGVTAIGMGSNLFEPQWLQTGNFEAISQRVRDILAWISEVRGELSIF